MTVALAQVQFNLPDLLQCAGARLVSDRRADCPRCGGRRTVSYATEVFNCHHAGCEFRGSTTTLARDLGLSNHLSAAEHEAVTRGRARARQAAAWLTAELRARRFQLYDAHQALLTIIFGASARLVRDICNEAAWCALACAFPALDSARAEITLLEHAPLAARIAFLGSTPTEGKDRLRTIIESAGLYDDGKRFIEVETHCPGMLTHD